MSANSLYSRVKDVGSRVLNAFMPLPEDDDEYEEDTASLQEQHQEYESVRERRVAGGGTVSSFAPSSFHTTGSHDGVHTSSTGDAGTQFTVHTTKVAELKVRIHRPRRYDDAAEAVLQFKQGIAIAVNFDCMEEAERRRVCDFLNGACYVLHGTGRVVSSTIVLYAPKGVTVTDAMVLHP